MTKWHPDPAMLKRPYYRSLVDLLSGAISAGHLSPGERLPTHRGMAETLRLSVQTVSRAYDELHRRGLVSGEVGRGTFVRSDASEMTAPYIRDGSRGALIDLSIVKPVADERHARRLSKTLKDIARGLPSKLLFSFRPDNALGAYRDAGVRWLGHCGLRVAPENIHLTNGITPAMTVAILAAVGPGNFIATEELGLHMLAPLARYLAIGLAPVRMDEQGVIPEALDAVCGSSRVRAVCLIPSGAGPTTAVMGAQRREAIVGVARRHDLIVIENDAWGPLLGGGLPPLASLAPERTLYMTSFTKCIMPGLRCGYLAVPDAMNPAIANRQLVTNWMATPLIAEIASRWVGDGTAEELVLWQRETLTERNRIASKILGNIPRRQLPSGLHLWLPLPQGWGADAFVAHAKVQGVAVAPGPSFATGQDVPASAVRVSLGSTSPERLAQGIEIIARLARGQPEPAVLAI